MTTERIYRKVVDYKIWEKQKGRYGSINYAQRETLSCGHTIGNKGSVGRALKRRCKECEELRDGKIVTWPSLGMSEVWNPDTELPVKIQTPE